MTLRYPAHRVNSIEKYVAESITSAAAAAIIPLADRTLVRLAFSGAGVIDLEAGTEDGLYRILIAETVAGTTQLINSATVSLSAAWQPVAAGEVLEVIWNATISRWCEVARSPISGGGGGAPAIGGAITGGTAGSVLFVDPAATIAQDNANFFFDNANNRLGIGTAVPLARLHLAGSSGLRVDTVGAQWAVLGADVAGANYMTLRRPGTTAALGYIGGGAGGAISAGTANDLGIRSEASLYIATNGVPQVSVDTAGNVGIGDLTPVSKLSVGATSEFQVNSTGDIAAINNVAYGFPAVQGLANTFLRNDGAGALTWQSAGGGLSEPEVMARAAWRMW